MHSSYMPSSSSSSARSSRRRATVQSNTPTRNRVRPTVLHRRNFSNPASLGGAPRPVTPTDHLHASWIGPGSPRIPDSPRSLPYRHPHSVPPEVVLGHSVRTSDLRSGVSDMRSVVSDMPLDLPNNEPDDLPMDEAQHTGQHVSPDVLDSMRQQVESSQKEVERLTALLQKSQSSARAAVDAADRGGGVAADAADMADDVSSLGNDDHTSQNKLTKLVQAIAQTNQRPPNLTNDEKALWDAYQSRMTKVKTDESKKRRDLEQQVLDTASQLNQVRVREKILQEQLEETTQELHSLQKDLASHKSKQEKSLDEQQRQRATQAMKVRHLEDQLSDMESKYKEARDLAESQQEEHDRAICAIQRVLADVTTERDKALEDLQVKLDAAMAAQDIIATKAADTPGDSGESIQKAVQLERETQSLKTMLNKVEKDRDTVQKDLDQKGGDLVILEQELNVVNAALQKAVASNEDLKMKLDEKTQNVVNLEGELAGARHQVELLTKREEEMAAEAEDKKSEIHKLRRMQRHMKLAENESKAAAKRDSPSADVESLEKELAETHASLENAKKIITSLESANGSLAQDLRGKLKEKDEKVQGLEVEATERKRNLDCLATELRDLQRRKGEMDRLDHWSRGLIRKQQVLALQLETALNDLQNAAVVFEATMESGSPDPECVDNISRLLANTLGAVKYASMDVRELETLERTASQDSELDSVEGASLRQELEQRKLQVNRLEESLKKCKEELDALRRQSTQEQSRHEEDETKMQTEILMLRDQCKTNMEVLAKKERELEVLRDSLDVGDEGVGYISDDASSDGDDEARALEPPMSPSAASAYSHSQTEALVTLMANASFSGTEAELLRKELRKANIEKDKAAKELKAGRESLANAKMIISSLERANKDMMEDLRQRLQDSNTAIASLLDKSMQSDKQSTFLKAELEKLKREREQEAEEHKVELQKVKEEALAQALKLRILESPASSEETNDEAVEESKQDF